MVWIPILVLSGFANETGIKITTLLHLYKYYISMNIAIYKLPYDTQRYARLILDI